MSNSRYRSYSDDRIRDMKKMLTGWMYRTTMNISGLAKKNLSSGAGRSTGMTANSIQYYVNFPISTVVCNTAYARYIEGVDKDGNDHTTARHFVPWRLRSGDTPYPMFTLWARRHGFDTDRPGGLWTWGYQMRFFRKAIEAYTPVARADAQGLRL